MFASEKVMLEYLGQLLQEEQPEQQETLTPEPIQAISSRITQEQESVSNDQPKARNTSEDSGLRPIPQRKTNPLDFVESTAKSGQRSSPARVMPQVQAQTKAEPESDPQPFKEPELPETQSNSIEKLLEQVSVKQQEEKIAKERQKTVDLVRSVSQEQLEVKQKLETASEAPTEEVEEEFPEEPFQALFFEVAGLVLAVPLQELGGIHNLTEVNSLFGKPEWFHGVMINREKKLNVVDSARWVMPEKFTQKMEESLNYQYLIMLGESAWGFAAERLVETELIQPDAVKWRSKAGKRPWLMGTIKEKMCALLHVSDLIAMLEQGIDARQV